MGDLYRLRRISGRSVIEYWEAGSGTPGRWVITAEATPGGTGWEVRAPFPEDRFLAHAVSRDAAEKWMADHCASWTPRGRLLFFTVETPTANPPGIRFRRRSVLRAASMAAVYERNAYHYEHGGPTAASWDAADRVRAIARSVERCRFKVR